MKCRDSPNRNFSKCIIKSVVGKILFVLIHSKVYPMSKEYLHNKTG